MSFINLFSDQAINAIEKFFSTIHVPIFNFQGSNKDILLLWGYVSLGLYFLSAILRKFFKIRFEWTLKKKLLTVIIAVTVCCALTLSFISLKINNIDKKLFIGYGLFYIFTILASFYGLTISHLINKLISFLNRIEEKNT
ncbi:MAG: hypothetical protein HY764_03175 [Candidatus Portnoybacteria bacterium]|nr:hypothetical protein [Candidatus Portnoybacteria bacterium]